MKKFVCTVCGYVCQGEQPPENCPVCRQPREKFREEALEGGEVSTIELSSGKTEQKEDVFSMELSYDKNFYRVDQSCRYMEEIHQMAVTGKEHKLAGWCFLKTQNQEFTNLIHILQWPH